jgi:hypothetical protein
MLAKIKKITVRVTSGLVEIKNLPNKGISAALSLY